MTNEVNVREEEKKKDLTVSIVDNDGLLLDMLAGFLASSVNDMKIRWVTGDIALAFDRCLDDKQRPDVLLVDMLMGAESGVCLCRKIRMRANSVAILGMTSYDLSMYASSLAAAGAQGLVSKVPLKGLLRAIRAVGNGKTYYQGSDVRFQTVQESFLRVRHCESKGVGPLSVREAEVMDLVLQGNSSIEIAAIMQCAPATVRSHIGHIKTKLNADGLGQAAAKWAFLRSQL